MKQPHHILAVRIAHPVWTLFLLALALAVELHANDFGQAHPRGAAQHHVFGFQPAYAHGDHA